MAYIIALQMMFKPGNFREFLRFFTAARQGHQRAGRFGQKEEGALERRPFQGGVVDFLGSKDVE